jgi:hypothetical protein
MYAGPTAPAARRFQRLGGRRRLIRLPWRSPSASIASTAAAGRADGHTACIVNSFRLMPARGEQPLVLLRRARLAAELAETRKPLLVRVVEAIRRR